MKKILLGFLMVFTSLALFGCKDKEPEKPQLENPVTLAGLSASTTSSTTKTKSKMGYKLDTTTPNYQFVVLMNDTTNFELTIKLDNPNDYHIFDFTLTCEDENAKVFVDDEYELLSNLKSLNWRGTTNTKYVLKMQVSSTAHINTLKLTSMYYSDREDGTNKYDVNLNDKGTIDVYRLYEGVEIEVVNYSTQKIKVTNDSVDKSSIKINNTTVKDGDKIDLKFDKNTISYSFVLGDGIAYYTTFDYYVYDYFFEYKEGTLKVYFEEGKEYYKYFFNVYDKESKEKIFTKSPYDNNTIIIENLDSDIFVAYGPYFLDLKHLPCTPVSD